MLSAAKRAHKLEVKIDLERRKLMVKTKDFRDSA